MLQTKKVVFCLNFVAMAFASFCLFPVYHSGIHWMLSLKGSEGQIGLEFSELAKVNTCRTQMWSGALDSGRKHSLVTDEKRQELRPSP